MRVEARGPLRANKAAARVHGWMWNLSGLSMNLNLVEARSPLRATFVSGERTRRRHQRFMGQCVSKRKGGFP